MSSPKLIEFQKIGKPELGYISVGQHHKNIPFDIKRIYWVYDTPEAVERGNHANRSGQYVLVSLKGKVDIFLENIKGIKYHYILSDPNQGLFIPELHWRRLKMGPEVVCLSISSAEFDEKDYIRDYQEFLSIK